MGSSHFILEAISGASAAGKGAGLVPFREVPSQIDTDGYVWALKYAPNPAYVWPILNGVTLDPYFPEGAPQFTLDGNIITLTVPVNLEGTSLGDDWFWVWYFRKSATGSGTGKGQARQFGAGSGGAPGGPGTASTTGYFGSRRAGLGFTSTTEPADGDTITLGSITYTFRTTINNATPYEILTRDPSRPVIWNIVDAINNFGPSSGTSFSSATTMNPDVQAAADLGAIIIQARIGATTGAISLSSTGGSISVSVATISNGAMADGDTITVGSKTYTFRTTINNATPNELIAIPVSLGDSGSDGMPPLPLVYTVERALAEAINHGFGSGTYYSSATTAHPDVTATYDNLTEALTITSKTGGAVSITLSEATGSKFTWDGSTLGGGGSGSPGSGSPDDVVDWGADSLYNITGNLTVAIWVKIPSTGSSGGGIVFRGNDVAGDAPRNDAYSISASDDGAGGFSINYSHEYGAALGESHSFACALVPGKWYFLAIVRDVTAKTVKLYIGTGGGSVTLFGTWTYSNNPTDGTGDCRLTVGRGYPSLDFSSSPTVFDGGTIQEHYIYGRTLTSGELGDAMGGNPSLTGIVLGCAMGDDPEVDFSATGAEGTVTGTTLVQGHN